MTSEKAENIAQTLLETASKIGELDKILRDCTLDTDAIKIEPEAFDVLTGPEASDIAYAMRRLAMAFDRAALIKFNPES